LRRDIKEALSSSLASRVTTLLNSVNDCDNFKVYLSCVKDITGRPSSWQDFFKNTRSLIYTSDYHLKLPMLRFDAKHTVLTYSETANILLLTRPFEVGNYLRMLPHSNQYAFDSRPLRPTIPIQGKFTVLWKDDNFLIDLFSSNHEMESVIHQFNCPSSADVDKFISENKTVILHGFHTWTKKEKQDLITWFRLNSNPMSKVRVFVRLDSSKLSDYRFANYFDSQLFSRAEMTIKSLCTYMLSIETGLCFNTMNYAPRKAIELIDFTYKIDYDFSKELKQKQADAVKSLGVLKSAESENLFEIDLVQVLNSYVNKKHSSTETVDENRTRLSLYLIFSIAMKNIEKNRTLRKHSTWLTCHDSVALVNQVAHMISVMGEHVSQSFTQCLSQVLYFEGENNLTMLPEYSSQRLKTLFWQYCSSAFEGATTAMTKDNEFYRFQMKSVKKNYAELFRSVSQFPCIDPSGLSLATDRDNYMDSRRETTSILQAMKNLVSRKALKVSFTQDNKLLNSKSQPPLISYQQRACCPVRLVRDVDYSSESTSSIDIVTKKLCLLQVLNEINEIAKLDLFKIPMTNSLVAIKIQSMYPEDGEYSKSVAREVERDSKKFTKKLSIRKTLHRKSILENFRVDLLKRYSSRNPDSVMRGSVPEIKETGGQSSEKSSLALSHAGNSTRMRHTGAIRFDSVATASKHSTMLIRNFHSSSLTLKTRIDQVSDLLKLEFIPLHASAKRNSTIQDANRFLQSSIWQQVLALQQIISHTSRLVDYRSELYSGELSPYFGENEDLVLNYSKSEEPLSEQLTDIEELSKILQNKSIPRLEAALPINLKSISFDDSFFTLWVSLKTKASYIEQLSLRDDGQPRTGVYELNNLLRPVTLITSLRLQYALKVKVNYSHEETPIPDQIPLSSLFRLYFGRSECAIVENKRPLNNQRCSG
jgi:hypothetical protein